MITGETLIKGLFYFMLKAKGGKYLSRKEIVNKKTGKKSYQYTYASKKGEKPKAAPEKPVKQSKPKADKKGMDKPQEIAKQKGEEIKSLLSELSKVNGTKDLSDGAYTYYSNRIRESKNVSDADEAEDLIHYFNQIAPNIQKIIDSKKNGGTEKQSEQEDPLKPIKDYQKPTPRNRIAELNRNAGFKQEYSRANEGSSRVGSFKG